MNLCGDGTKTKKQRELRLRFILQVNGAAKAAAPLLWPHRYFVLCNHIEQLCRVCLVTTATRVPRSPKALNLMKTRMDRRKNWHTSARRSRLQKTCLGLSGGSVTCVVWAKRHMTFSGWRRKDQPRAPHPLSKFAFAICFEDSRYIL